MFLLIAYLLLALVVSFLCSIMESVLLSTPQPFLMVKEEEGMKWARSFSGLKKDIDRPLSAILSLNTVAHTIGAAGVGAQAVKVFGEVYFGLISAILTILILIFTEIIPKTLGARYWRGLARITTGFIRGTIVFTYPLVIMAQGITRLFSRNYKEESTSREEIAALASIGADEGLFSEEENKIIQNILKLKNVKVTEIMTPRVVVARADQELTLTEFLKDKRFINFSRIPIYSETEDNITGYVFRQTVFEKLAAGLKTMQLKEIRREIIVVPSHMVLFTLWEDLLSKAEHIALIVDEYGGMDGIVTMEDIIETLLGLEIVDERDAVTDMQAYARERWQARQAKYSYLRDDQQEEVSDQEKPTNQTSAAGKGKPSGQEEKPEA